MSYTMNIKGNRPAENDIWQANLTIPIFVCDSLGDYFTANNKFKYALCIVWLIDMKK